MKYHKKSIQTNSKEKILSDLRGYAPPSLYFEYIERYWPESMAESEDGLSYLIKVPTVVRREDDRRYYWFYFDNQWIVFFITGIFSNLVEFEYLPSAFFPPSPRLKKAINDSLIALGTANIGPGNDYESVSF